MVLRLGIVLMGTAHPKREQLQYELSSNSISAFRAPSVSSVPIWACALCDTWPHTPAFQLLNPSGGPCMSVASSCEKFSQQPGGHVKPWHEGPGCQASRCSGSAGTAPVGGKVQQHACCSVVTGGAAERPQQRKVVIVRAGPCGSNPNPLSLDEA